MSSDSLQTPRLSIGNETATHKSNTPVMRALEDFFRHVALPFDRDMLSVNVRR